jgi:hypothetical protein
LGFASELDNFYLFIFKNNNVIWFCAQFPGNCEQAKLQTFWGTSLTSLNLTSILWVFKRTFRKEIDPFATQVWHRSLDDEGGGAAPRYWEPVVVIGRGLAPVTILFRLWLQKFVPGIIPQPLVRVLITV